MEADIGTAVSMDCFLRKRFARSSPDTWNAFQTGTAEVGIAAGLEPMRKSQSMILNSSSESGTWRARLP